jgi:hypothetical protein
MHDDPTYATLGADFLRRYTDYSCVWTPLCMQVATIAALAAEAYMNAYAWNYTVSETSATLRQEAATALELINYALSLEPKHVLALHLKIHLLETQPLETLHDLHAHVDAQASGGRVASLREAEAAADTLAALRHSSVLPGHLIHMPAHIFLRVGRWQDGIEVRPPRLPIIAAQ